MNYHHRTIRVHRRNFSFVLYYSNHYSLLFVPFILFFLFNRGRSKFTHLRCLLYSRTKKRTRSNLTFFFFFYSKASILFYFIVFIRRQAIEQRVYCYNFIIFYPLSMLFSYNKLKSRSNHRFIHQTGVLFFCNWWHLSHPCVSAL